MPIDKQVLFNAENAVISKILNQGMQIYFDSLANAEAAFRSAMIDLSCIDDRTPGTVHLAGSGILLGLEQAELFCRRAGVRSVTYHKICGAVRLWMERQGLKPTDEQVDAKSEWFSRLLARKLSVPCVEKNIHEDEHHFHKGRVIYYDGKGNFDRSRVKGLPSGFTISRAFFEDPKLAQEEVSIALSIIFSESGFNELVETVPLISIGSNQKDIDKFCQELEIASTDHRQKVKIDYIAA